MKYTLAVLLLVLGGCVLLTGDNSSIKIEARDVTLSVGGQTPAQAASASAPLEQLLGVEPQDR